METVKFTELQSCGYLNDNLYIDYKRNISYNTIGENKEESILAILKITEYSKCPVCVKRKVKRKEKRKEYKKLTDSIDMITPLIKEEKDYTIKNEYILIFNDNMISTLPTELRNIDRILPLIKVLLENKLNYEIIVHSNYLTMTLYYRLFNVLNKTSLHLLNSKVYDCFNLYTSLSSTLNIYKDDIIKQNTFENIRRKLLSLDDLGPYNNLKNKLKQPSHIAKVIKEKGEEKTSCCL